MIRKIAALLGSILIVGTSLGLFIESLNWVIGFFQSHWRHLIWGLPLITMAVAYIEKFKDGKRFGDTTLITEEIKNPQRHVHWLLAPWIFILTLLFHFFGASVGRESTAVQMGASLTESWGRILKIPLSDRPIIMRMGLAAGFGAAFGVPFAGAIFGLETPLLFRKKDWLSFPFYLAASMGSHHWSTFLFGSEHAIWQQLPTPMIDITGTAYLLLFLFMIGLCLTYEILFERARLWLKKWTWWALSGMGAVLILTLTFFAADPKFNNLGVNFIVQGFQQGASVTDALNKLVFTFISIVSGMKGGEVTPLMAAGTLFGSWIGSLIPGLGFQIGAALGLVSLLSLRLRIPLTTTVMLVEIFDWKVGLLGFPLVSIIEIIRHRLRISPVQDANHSCR